MKRAMLRRVLGVLVLAAFFPSRAAAQPAPHRLFLRVVDPSGNFIPGLTAADVSVIEGGTKREIVRLAPANDPMRLVMLVDNAEAMHSSLEDVRKGVQSFIDGIAPEHEIALVTIGDKPFIRQAPTTDHAKLKDLAQKMTTSGSTILIAAVMDMYNRLLKDAAGRWPMFIIMTSDGPEDSGRFDPAKFTAMVQEMQQKDFVVHAIVMSTMGRGVEVQVTQALTQATRGRYDSISASSALPQKMAALAAAVTADFASTSGEYILEYASPSTDPNAPLDVRVNRDAHITLSRDGRIR
jgi:hypothetical protein